MSLRPGARQVQQIDYNHLKNQVSHFTSLIALIFPLEFDVLSYGFSPA